jgi:aerobic carbon-monoxide dehydrogenase large subunit
MVDPERKGQGIGASVLRKEDARFLRGIGCYVDDIELPGLQEVTFLRSPLAHARILSIRKPQGAEPLVFVAEDLDIRAVQAKLGLPGFKSSEYPALARGKVRFVGEAVAMCVAATRAEGEDLAGRIELDLEPLPAVVDAIAGRDAPAALVHDAWKDNLFLQTAFDKGIAEVAATAPVVVRRSYRLARQVMNPLEGKAVLAHWDARTNQLVVYTSTQVPHMIRTAIAEHLGIAQGSVRVIAPDVGGAFGYKCVLQPEELCVAWLALTFKTPFRWIEDRREHLISGANCREHHYAVTAYADERGKLLGLDADITVDAGAYSVWPFTSCLESTMAARHLPGPYALPAYRVRTSAVATNKPPIVPYRGVARTGICFAIELTIDAVARAVGREACDVRRENLVPATAMPFVTVTGNAYDSGDYRRSLDLARERVDLPAIRARQAKADGDTLIGVGFANYIEMTAHGTALFSAAGYPFTPGHEQAAVRFTPDGGLEIRVGVHSHGQGMETSLAQIAHEVLGIPVAAIAVVLGDTAMTPYSTGTYASRSITMAGGAVARACEILKRRLAAIAAHLLQCTVSDVSLRAGVFYGPTGDIPVRDVAATWYLHPQRLPPDTDGMEVTGGFKPKVDSGQYSYGTHAAVVEIDRALGSVRILDYVIVEDCGTMVNPMIVEGQTLGGAAQGIGTALFEEMAFDANGQPQASTLADYMMPGATDMPRITIHHIETPSPHTDYGIKGVGEGGAIPPPAAIFNAVNDALRGLGVEFSETPLTPPKLVLALAEAAARKGGNVAGRIDGDGAGR